MTSKKTPTAAERSALPPDEGAGASDLPLLLDRMRRSRAVGRSAIDDAQKLYAHSREARASYSALLDLEREMRLATLNLMEDATEARRRSDVDARERDRAEAAVQANEERLRLILDNARDYAIISLDLERRITSWSAGAAAIIGFSEAEVIGMSADFIFTQEDCASGLPAREAVTALAHERATDERWHVRRDGSRFWASGVMMAMRDASGAAVGFVKIFRDQTDELHAKNALEEGRVRLIEALEETEAARAEAEAAGKAKDYFLAVLSHELRTPLTPVLLAVQMLERRRDLPPQVLQTLATIRRNVQLEARFVDEILDVTKIARGKLELLREPMDLHEAVARAVDVCLPDLDAKRQRVDVALAATAHRIDGDVPRLQQVVWNLLSNASKFSAAGAHIRVRTLQHAGARPGRGRRHGIGIEPASCPTCSSRSTRPTRRSRAASAAWDWAWRSPRRAWPRTAGRSPPPATGPGAAPPSPCACRLPATGRQRAHNRAPMPAKDAAVDPKRFRALRVLLVENDPDTQAIFRLFLQQSGHEVRAVDTVAAALAALAETRFDVLIADIGLADGTGWDLMHAVRERGLLRPRVAIAMSGYGMAADRARSAAAGYAQHLVKPVDLDTIDAVLAAAVPDTQGSPRRPP